jgi:KUP system potassium uptake protein
VNVGAGGFLAISWETRMKDPTAVAPLPEVRTVPQDQQRQRILKLAVGAIGIVFGDIGTSPIYAFRETFTGHHPITPDPLHIHGVLSLIFWSMMIVVTIKYVVVIMRADNQGEGGSLALLALISREISKRRWTSGIVLLGVFACALFYGDSMITPAISVLSAVEGLQTIEPRFGPFVLPVAVIILMGLFSIQSHGTRRVASFFGPIMLLYFATISVFGIIHIAGDPAIILHTLNPLNAFDFFLTDNLRAFLAMGSVVLAVTGAEALYADMGHFGRKPIGLSWLVFVMPALMLNYMGQGAMVLSLDADGAMHAIRNPFFLLAPGIARLPLVILATLATIIASQAVISGAFSVTQQAIHLGFVPRLRICHTSETAAGQIYIPIINWTLMTMVMLLVLLFRSSSNLAAAYGIAVTGAMFIDGCLLAVVLLSLWKWPAWAAVPLLALFFVVDMAYFGANLMKVPEGGWFPLLVGIVAFTFLTTWAKGRKLLAAQMRKTEIAAEDLFGSSIQSVTRVPGTAVYMTSQPHGIPQALQQNVKHNRVVHERSLFVRVAIEPVPYVASDAGVTVEDLGQGFFRVTLHRGFMEEVNVPKALQRLGGIGAPLVQDETSFFLSRQTPLATKIKGMALWRERLFAWMMRNAESPMGYFCLPPHRVVELGAQVKI